MATNRNDASRAGLATSRRNFVAGTSLMASAVAISMLRPSRARATHNPNHVEGVSCNNPGKGTPAHCICFLRGTHISTPNGEIAIEKLRIGDLVTTANGTTRPVKWLGFMRHLRQSDHWSAGVRPVRISAGSLDGRAPHRDLLVSAAHMLYLDGVLIPAGDLVNGTSIVLEDALDQDTLDYFHVELESHDILVAEGAAAESLLANPDNRSLFDNYAEFVELYGADAPSSVPCAPIMTYYGGRGELASRWRSIIAPVVDVRRPLEVARDRIDNLAMRRAA
jgi:hypothetical protein